MHSFKRQNQQSGFVLVLAIGATLLLALVVSAVALNVQGLISIASDTKQRDRLAWESISARSNILYSVLTGEKTRLGFSNLSLVPRVDEMGDLIQTPQSSDLRVDGRWYLMNGFPFSLQDKAGLLNANALSQHEFEQLFYGRLDRRTSVEILAQQYSDFIDTDNEQRFLGAERRAYSRENKPPPLNRSLFLSSEISKLLQWPEVFMPWESMHAEQLTWNINTAPKAVLHIKTSAPSENIERFLRNRELEAYTSLTSAEKKLGAGTILQEVESISTSFSRRFRFAFIKRNMCDKEPNCDVTMGKIIGLGNVDVEVMDITLTPTSDFAPFSIDSVKITSLFQYLYSRELKYPITQGGAISQLSSGAEKATIYPQYETDKGRDDLLPLDILTSLENVPVVEYKNKTLSLSKN